MPRPDLCVIYNPAAGKNRARARLERIRTSWGAHADFRPTQHVGHAVELAEQAAREGFRVIAAAGGDGTAHEVLNGIMRVPDANVQFSIIPIGSANDYAYSLGLDKSNAHIPGRVDVGRVNTPNGKSVYFGCCLGVGFNGAVTWEAIHIKRLQGVFLYGLATLRALVNHYRPLPMTIQFDDDAAWPTPTVMFSALIGNREGGFLLGPNAKVDDGLFDFVHAADLSRWEIMKLLPRVALFGAPSSYPKVRQGRCRRVKLTSAEPFFAHTDGELLCVPKDGVRELDIEIVPSALSVTRLSLKEPHMNEASAVFVGRSKLHCARPADI